MSTHKHIDVICLAAALAALLLCGALYCGEALGLRPASRALGYEDRLFDTSRVHTVDIVMDGWDDFLTTCENEEYAACTVTIDGETYSNVGLRAKGNTSLSTVAAMDSDRYSFKLEFDQYNSAMSYHGLDKLCLNNLIQDATMMKDYLTDRLMGAFDVAAPLCSYVYITVNGGDWGLYLAVEGVEDAFLRRNYGSAPGELYKPDSMNFGGGGPGHGQDFSMDEFLKANPDAFPQREQDGHAASDSTPALPEDFDPAALFEGDGEDFAPGDPFDGKGPGGMGSADVKLQYIDDDPDSYSDLFNSAKTDLTAADKTRLIAALKTLSEGEAPEEAVDVDQVLRYFVVHNFVVNGDSYTGSMVHNYYLYEKNGLLSMIPWDYNLAFGTFQGNDADSAVNDPIDTPLSVDGSGDRPMADWIFASETYTELYHRYFTEFLDSVDVEALIDEAAALIAPYVERDPTKFYTMEEFETGVETLRTFCRLRQESIRGQLAGTIPSTGAGQAADSTALVDAAQIELSDMGTMSMGGGPDGMERPDRRREETVQLLPAPGKEVPELKAVPGGKTEERLRVRKGGSI